MHTSLHIHREVESESGGLGLVLSLLVFKSYMHVYIHTSFMFGTQAIDTF